MNRKIFIPGMAKTLSELEQEAILAEQAWKESWTAGSTSKTMKLFTAQLRAKSAYQKAKDAEER